LVFYLQINVIFASELLVGSFKFQGFHTKFFIKIILNHRTPLNSLNSLRDRLTQKITKYIIKVCDLSFFRWTKINSELWYIAILQKRSQLKNSVFWFSLVFSQKFIEKASQIKNFRIFEPLVDFIFNLKICNLELKTFKKLSHSLTQ
jgi:hypothetical protein